MRRIRFFANSLAAIALVSLVTISSTQAATRTWDGDTSGKWSDAGNWDIAPVNSDSLTFSGTANQANTNDAGITTIGTLTLSSGGWDINLGSLNTATPCGIGSINATGGSTLRGNFAMGDADSQTIALSGSGITLTIADKLTMYRANNNMTLVVNGAGNTLLLGSLALGASGGNKTISGSANVTVNGPMSDSITGNFTWSGSGTFTLNGVNTYDRPTYINAGTLALGASGSINNVPSIKIAAGATFDVSAQSAYTLSTNLTASGTATPATIKGAASGTVSMGSLPITLTWGGASSGIDSTHPPLTIDQAALTLNNNKITVDVPGAALGEGVYTLISAPAGISGTINTTPSYSGYGQDPGLRESVHVALSISSNSVILTIFVPPVGTVMRIR